jgi:hypothetical protein
MVEFTEKDMIAFGNFLLSKERESRMRKNLKGSRTGTPISKHLATVTVADIEHFKSTRYGGKEGNV